MFHKILPHYRICKGYAGNSITEHGKKRRRVVTIKIIMVIIMMIMIVRVMMTIAMLIMIMI